MQRSITKTCLYNFDPIRPHFYIVKLGLTGMYIIFLISTQNIDCGYSLEPPLCFGQKYEKYQNFLSENFQFLVVKFSVYLNRHVFVLERSVPRLYVQSYMHSKDLPRKWFQKRSLFKSLQLVLIRA